MTPELEAKLRAAHPAFFANCPEILIDDGWFDLVSEAATKLSPLGCNANHVKSKCVSLRLYLSNVPPENREEIHRLSEELEQRSHYVCEDCGQVGKSIIFKGYYRVVCPTHEAVWNKRTAKCK